MPFLRDCIIGLFWLDRFTFDKRQTCIGFQSGLLWFFKPYELCMSPLCHCTKLSRTLKIKTFNKCTGGHNFYSSIVFYFSGLFGIFLITDLSIEFDSDEKTSAAEYPNIHEKYNSTIVDFMLRFSQGLLFVKKGYMPLSLHYWFLRKKYYIFKAWLWLWTCINWLWINRRLSKYLYRPFP